MGKLRDNLNLLFSNLLFGANFSIYVSLLRNYFDYRQLFLLQAGVAALFFIPFVLMPPRVPRLRWRDAVNIVIVTVLIVYGWMYMMLWGAAYTNPIDASILTTLGPVFTLMLAVALHREPVSWIRITGIAVALAGVGVLLFKRGFHLVEGSEGWGNALVLVGGRVALIAERQGRRLRVIEENSLPETVPALARAYLAGQLFPRLNALCVKEAPACAVPALEQAGFRREMLDYVLRR